MVDKVAPPKKRIDIGLIVALVIGCIAGGFVVRYAAKKIPNRAVGGLASQIAGDVAVDERPLRSFSLTGDIRGLAFTPDGSNLFVGDREGLSLCDATSGKVKRTFDTEENGVRALSLSPSGGAVSAALAYTGEVRLYATDDTSTTAAMTFRGGDDKEQQAIAFAPDGNTLAGGGFDKTLRLWYAEGGSLANASGNGKVFDTTVNSGTGSSVRQQVVKLGDAINAVAFSPDGKTVAVATGPKVTFVDVATRKTGQTLFANKETITALVFSPDGKTLVSGLGSGNIILWESATGRRTATIPPATGTNDNASLYLSQSGSGSGVTALTYTTDGKQILIAMKSGIVQICEGGTGKVLKLLADPDNDRAALSLALAADGKSLAVGHSDGTIRIWKP